MIFLTSVDRETFPARRTSSCDVLSNAFRRRALHTDNSGLEFLGFIVTSACPFAVRAPLSTHEPSFRSVPVKSDAQTEDSVPTVASFSPHHPETQPLAPSEASDAPSADLVSADGILQILSSPSHPLGMKATEIVERSGADKKTRHRVRRLLAELLEAGQLERGPGKRYAVAGTVSLAAPQPAPTTAPAKSAKTAQPPTPTVVAPELPPDTVYGRILIHPGGFGFVQRDDGGDNIFIAARYRGVAMDRDKVALKVWQGYRGPEGRVLSIVERGRARITGVIESATYPATLRPDDPRIQTKVLLDGDVDRHLIGKSVVAEITEYPKSEREPISARLLAVLGAPDDPKTEIAKILACEEVEERFPPAVEAEAKTVPEHVTDADLVSREDLRHVPFVTIDPETARDFDDAVCVEAGPDKDQLRLWVAVADVSHYVRPGTATDREAERRGVSVYLPDRVVSMLPLPLSAGICSLNPKVDRLAMVARLDIDRHGFVVGRKLMAAVIRSRARFDYAGVASVLFGQPSSQHDHYQPFLPQLRLLQDVAGRLRDQRDRRGGLDFDLPEAKVILAADDPRLVVTVKRSRADALVRRAYQMIEDAMLAANEAVAEYFAERGLDVLWRVHAPPRREPLQRLSELAHGFGFPVDPEAATEPLALRTFLETIKGQPCERSLSYLVLRSLNQAVYSVDNVGHFGLGARRYLHFTSPIRRYPDLVVHRLLKLILQQESQPAGKVFGTWPPRKEMKEWATDSSLRERRAMEVERQVVDLYRALLMRERIGEEFSGIVSGVTSAGLFVEIDDPYVEGLVRSDRLDEDYELNDKTLRYETPKHGPSIGLGDAVRVRIDSVSVPQRRIELSLLSDPSARSGKSRRSRSGQTPEPSQRSYRDGKKAARSWLDSDDSDEDQPSQAKAGYGKASKSDKKPTTGKDASSAKKAPQKADQKSDQAPADRTAKKSSQAASKKPAKKSKGATAKGKPQAEKPKQAKKPKKPKQAKKPADVAKKSKPKKPKPATRTPKS